MHSGWEDDPNNPRNWPGIYYEMNRRLSLVEISAIRLALKQRYRKSKYLTEALDYPAGKGVPLLSLHFSGGWTDADWASFVAFSDALVSQLNVGAKRHRS